MKIDRVKIGAVLMVLLCGVLSLLFWDFIRDTVVAPIYYLLWIGNLILASIPQAAFLIFLFFASLIISAKTVQSVRVRPITRASQGSQYFASTRYQHWRALCTSLYYNWFSRNRFASECRELLLSILAYQMGKEIFEIEALVRDGALHVPDSVKDIVLHKTIRDPKPVAPNSKNLLSRLRRAFFGVRSNTDSQIESQVAEIVSFIEHCLEINHAGNGPYS